MKCSELTLKDYIVKSESVTRIKKSGIYLSVRLSKDDNSFKTHGAIV